MKSRLLSVFVLLSAPTLTWAHIGADAGTHHESAFLTGFVHPFTGTDHMLAMIVVGLWSALALRRIWAAPVVFASILLIGGLLGFGGIQVPVVEPMIAASLLVLGLLLATRAALPTAAALGLVSVFALFHGVAHGSELPAGHALAALTGMVLATLVLHLSGIVAGYFARTRSVWLPRLVGAGVATVGVGLLGGLL